MIFSMYIYNIQPCNLKLAILLGGKKTDFSFKTTLRSQLFMDTWHLASNPGDLGSPWVTIINDLEFSIHPWQVGLGTCQWFRTGGPSSGAEDDSTSDRWRWIWARKVQRRQREIWMFGTVEGHDSSWCFKIVSLALAWLRFSCVAFHGLNQSTPKPGACSLLSLPNQGRMRGGDFAGRSSSMTGLGQSTLQVRHKLMNWNYAKKI